MAWWTGLILFTAVLVVGATAATTRPAAAAGGEDWLTAVNHFRAQAGVPPVREDPTLNDAATAHACYMVANGVSHAEDPALPGYTVAGSESGERSNVAVSSSATATDRSFVELWMAAPYHAIGVLRPGTTTMSYGSCRDPGSAPWRSGATLDVLAGASGAPIAQPVVWPGDGARLDLDRFIAESPSPVTECGWSGVAGLPLVALLPETPTAANAQLAGPDGPVTTCVLTAATSTSPTAKAILAADDAVVVVPREPLAPGAHTVTLTTAARTVRWSFTIDPAAADWNDGGTSSTDTGSDERTAPTGGGPIAVAPADAGFVPLAPRRLVDSRTGTGTGRLRAGVVAPITIAGTGHVPADAQAASLNLTVVGPAGDGYLSAYPCDGAPVVSSVNFSAGRDTPNAALVPLDPAGRLCLYASVDTDVLIDVNGVLRDDGSGRFVPVTPTRLVDSRQGLRAPGRLAPGRRLQLQVTGPGSPVPNGASAVVLNVTATDSPNDGYISVYPCGPTEPVVSNLNPRAGETRPNLVIVPLTADGALCVTATAAAHLIVDVTGWVHDDGQRFRAVAPTRLADTRASVPLPAGEVLRVPVAGTRGLPATATAISANITAPSPQGVGYVTAFGCGSTPPPTSTLNLAAGQDTANGAQVQLGADGDLCLYTTVATHLIVDINGVWG